MINRRISGEAELTWDAIVEDARAKGDSTNLVPEDGGQIVVGMGPLTVADPMTGAVTLKE